MKFIEKPLSENETLKNYQDKFTLKQDEESEYLPFSGEFDLAYTDKDLIIGVSGHVLLTPLEELDKPVVDPNKTRYCRLERAGTKNVSVLVHEKHIYAGSNGYVYRISLEGNNITRNTLPEMGHQDVSLAVTHSHLVIGTNGYVVLVPLDKFNDTNANINISLPGCGYDNVSLLVTKNHIYAGSQGYVYQMDLQGENLVSNNLPERGYHPISLALTAHHLVAGTYGYVTLVPLDDFDDGDANINISLPGCGYENVTVLTYENHIYAGSNGYIYQLDQDGANMVVNNLPGRGYHEIRLTIYFEQLIVGIDGYVVGVFLNDFGNSNKNKNIYLKEARSGIVTVLFNQENAKLYAGCNGYVYRILDDTQRLTEKEVSKNVLLSSIQIPK